MSDFGRSCGGEFEWINAMLISRFALTLVLSFATSTVLFAQESADLSGDIPTRQTAYVIEFGDLQVITRYRDRFDKPVFAPRNASVHTTSRLAKLPETVWIKFQSNGIEGYADLERPVRCLLVQNENEETAYGVYGLWKDKRNLLMPLPIDDESVSWEGVSAEDALNRLLVGRGVSEQQSREIVSDFGEQWFDAGLRAILIQANNEEEQPDLTIIVHECVRE